MLDYRGLVYGSSEVRTRASQGLSGTEHACQAGDAGDGRLVPGLEDPLEKGMATHSSILAWEIPWTEEPGGLQSMGLQRIVLDLVAKQQQGLRMVRVGANSTRFLISP